MELVRLCCGLPLVLELLVCIERWEVLNAVLLAELFIELLLLRLAPLLEVEFDRGRIRCGEQGEVFDGDRLGDGGCL